MSLQNHYHYTFPRVAVILTISIAVLALLWTLRSITTIVVISLITSYIFVPLTDRLDRAWKLPHFVSAALIVVLVLTSLLTLPLVFFPILQQQLKFVLTGLPENIITAIHGLNRYLETYLNLSFPLNRESLQSWILNNTSQIQKISLHTLEILKSRAQNIIGITSQSILFPFVFYYALANWQQLSQTTQKMIPPRWHAGLQSLSFDIRHVISNYLRSTSSVMFLLAAYYSIGLAIIGLEEYLAIGILTGMLYFVPYLGISLGFLMSLMAAFIQEPSLHALIPVAIIFALGQFIESFLLTPFLVGDKIGIPPVIALIALFVFAQLFGVIGMLIALPATAILLVCARYLMQYYRKSAFYNE